jgi:hypothetical protein
MDRERVREDRMRKALHCLVANNSPISLQQKYLSNKIKAPIVFSVQDRFWKDLKFFFNYIFK